jgi:hypothetical protein
MIKWMLWWHGHAIIKQRMGTTLVIHMAFDLEILIKSVEKLEDLVRPFTIDQMVIVDKAPIPHGSMVFS